MIFVRKRTSWECRRALRAYALMLGVFALMLQALAPLCLGGMNASAGGSYIVICTAHGTQTIRLDSNGNPLPNAPVDDQSHSACFLCLNPHGPAGFVPPEQAALFVPTLSKQALRPVYSAVLPRAPHTSYVSRAPPFVFA
jgi:Protein of unknown function (DUF2946)